MRLRQRLADRDETDIDVTALLDVVFIMLIFFIMTASFVNESGIELYRALHPTGSVDYSSTPIVVKVLEANQVTIDGRHVNKRAITATVVRLRAERPGSLVEVSVSKRAKTKNVIAAIDGIRGASIFNSTVSLIED